MQEQNCFLWQGTVWTRIFAIFNLTQLTTKVLYNRVPHSLNNVKSTVVKSSPDMTVLVNRKGSFDLSAKRFGLIKVSERS